MSFEPCRRCGEAIMASARYCGTCGLDQRPDAPLIAVHDAQIARKREREWLQQPRDLSRIFEADAAKESSTTPAPTNDDAEDPPLDDLLYWVRSARMLGDLQGMATAQVERLRARCIAAGMPAAELDGRITDAVPDVSGAETVAPAGWYPDPDGGGAQRYWTGVTWTQRVR